MLSIHNLSYNTGENKLFSGINITVLPSCILYIKGNNGSGKTTLLQLIAGIKSAQVGQIYYNNTAIINLAKPYCTYIGHSSGFKAEFTVLQNLKFWSSVYGSNETLGASIHYFNLHDILNQKYYELSAGNKKKVSLARLLACHSNLWLLDEVDVNLDAQNKELLYNLIITKANHGGIILISSNNNDNSIKTANELSLSNF